MNREEILMEIDRLKKITSRPDLLSRIVGTSRQWGWDEALELICIENDIEVLQMQLEKMSEGEA